MTSLLVIRFSALGDVALLVPVLRSLVAEHKGVAITVLTRPKFVPLFSGMERVQVLEADVDGRFAGLSGLLKLYRHVLRQVKVDSVIDLHDNLRSRVLGMLFRLGGRRVTVFRKGRAEKQAYTRKRNKVIRPLQHTTERYREAFTRAGFDFQLLPPPHLAPGPEAHATTDAWLARQTISMNRPWIGIAPFARHATKLWPLENYPALLESLLKERPATFFLFGGGQAEVDWFEGLRARFPQHCITVAGQLPLDSELALLSRLVIMLCTDSANMHLAALAGVRVLSVWGGTHPDVGFGPLGQEANIIQVPMAELPCRPCSVYGTATCWRGDFACMNRIGEGEVVERILGAAKLG